MFRTLIRQYQTDSIGSQYEWAKLDQDDLTTLKTIFLEGACFDFSGILSELTGWPVYEIQWGTALADDPEDCDIGSPDFGMHRVVKHPSGRFIDASGWTDKQAVLTRVDALARTYQWMDEVDPDYGMTFAVDFELVKHAVVALLPADAGFV